MSHIQPPVVSVIIPVFNKWEYTFKCLMAVANNTGDVAHEVIVVDNASSDDTAQALPLLDGIRFQRNEKNFGFAKACNQGAAMARGKYLMFLNNDTEVRARWLSSMVEILDREPDVAMVGSKLLFPDGTLQHGGVIFAYAAPLPVTPFHVNYRRPAASGDQRLTLRAVTAACMLVRGEVFRAVGAFDEGFVNGYEDVDLCLKVTQTGAKIVYTPESVAVHHESVSEGRFNADANNVSRLNQHWHALLKAFEVDFRRDIRPMAIDPRRAAASVVVPMRDALWSLAPCLENLRYTTGEQDEIIVVDDGSIGPAGGFAKQIAAEYPQRFRVIRNETPRGLAAAALQGLEAATRPRAVVMAPSLRVVGDWLARLAAHLDAEPEIGAKTGAKIGALVPTLMPVESLPMQQLFYPLDLAPGGTATSGVAHPRAANPGDVEEIALPPALIAYAPRERLLEIARRVPDVLFGDDRGRLAVELRAQGLVLARARDTGVYRLVQIPGDADAELFQSYAAQSSSNLAYERAYRENGGAPIGYVTRAQTELTSIVVVARDNLVVTTDCLASILAHTHRSFEIVLVDNGSTEDYRGLVADLHARNVRVSWLRNERDIGYAQACNQGLAAARGEYLAILHNDVVVTPGWLSRQLALMAINPAVALTGPALSACSGSQGVGMRTYQGVGQLAAFAEPWAINHADEFAISIPLSGICLVMKRQVLNRIGGLDPQFGASIHTDDDFCIRAYRAGFRMAIAFDAFVHHAGAATWKALGIDRGKVAAESRRRFCEKWGLGPDVKVDAAVRELSNRPFDPARDHIAIGDAAPAATAPASGATKPLAPVLRLIG
jgi:GT2 family glycosyltransferase